ncbi:MAG TPA: AMP-binding protein [Methylotenera sp.]|nr:AMP-binding protein [Methylotenera sp.]HPH04582.1 AMP-binding protein [Methylotenera sp.]HPN00743.1 AMP-binding protein [Methylotenera sp.]
MLFEQLAKHAHAQADHIALLGQNSTLSYTELYAAVHAARTILLDFAGQATIALAVENSPTWVVLDLAAMANANPTVPLPAFFSAAQMQHAVQDAGVSVLITDNPAHYSNLFADFIQTSSHITIAGKTLTAYKLNIPSKTLPADTAKITYTSGTTGHPKGVCLSAQAMLQVANAIRIATQLNTLDQHLCVLPLATLLENVAGVYAALLAGATVHLLPSEQVGLMGSKLDVSLLHAALLQNQVTTAIFIPEMLQALVVACENGADKLPHLRFLAVGGASVSPQLLQRALKLGLPIFEGYGLSESASVVSLNTPQGNKIGSAGKPLPHVKVKISDKNEVFVKGANLLGYTGEQALTPAQDYIDTGDIGYLDEEGYLFINGRKKNVFITSFGRNVSPEWVERELKNSPHIAQAALFGEAKPWNVAVIVPRQPASNPVIQTTIDSINADLPDYARIGRYIIADAPFSAQNQQLTTNGKNRRDMILKNYQDKINALYLY